MAGYNCTMFAYGQTGAGKSYSFVGYGANKGILPIVSNQIFEKVRAPGRASGMLGIALTLTLSLSLALTLTLTRCARGRASGTCSRSAARTWR